VTELAPDRFPNGADRRARGTPFTSTFLLGPVRYEKGKPEKSEPVKLVTEYLAEDYTILAFKLLSLKAGYIYELRWFYK
jgi:hypothetical protein